MKKLILYIIFIIIASFFIGKTIANSVFEKKLDCIEYKQTINDLNDQLEEKQKIIDSLQINSWLFENYYCASENLFDTIFYHMTNDGTFVFEYEPYIISSNNIWVYEDLYNRLEAKRNSWK